MYVHTRSAQQRPSWSSRAGAVSSAALFGLALVLPVRAYVPAMPTNDTSYLDKTDASTLEIRYSVPPRVYSGPVSYQLRSDNWVDDTTKGALVHFTEASLRAAPSQNTTASTPWIAYISCDRNETDASDIDDIFTLARDHGAVSALLYSINSEACVLNREYIDDFEKPLDVFATVSKIVASSFDSQWSWTNDTFHTYNASLLNSSGADLNTTLAGEALYHRTYLGAILTSRNGTAQAISHSPPPPNDTKAASSSSSKKNNAMIALYVIVGFIAAMVCITIVSVIRRSLQPVGAAGRRHRGGDPDEPGPRRVGLAQAIVDTFPLQKFSKPSAKQLHSDSDLELPEYPPAAFKRDDSTVASSSLSPMTDSRRTSLSLDDDHCPICLLEFETGDDLRILPCAGQHRFHQACVDPWLLRVSTSCPLCRKDFNPEVEVDSSSDDEGTPDGTPAARTRTPRVTERYLALITRARRRTRTVSNAATATSDTARRRPLRPREADQNGPGGY